MTTANRLLSLTLLLALLCGTSPVVGAYADDGDATLLTMVVTNPTDFQRNEVVETDALPTGDYIVKNALGQQVPSQRTYDGRLLLYVNVQPHGTATYTLTAAEGTPSWNGPSWVGGRQYRERKDDLSFENDRVGFRLYGPALQRAGEQAYGTDLWLKHTPALILDTIYRRRHYHLDNGLGLDCYNVGPTMGCGGTARMVGDSIAYSWCYTDYEILDRGPLRFTVALRFADGERRLVSLDRGSHFCRTTVTWPQPADICAGIVLHRGDTTSISMDRDIVLYADPTRDPRKYNFQVYVGMLFPDGTDETRQQLFAQPRKDALGHLLAIRRGVATMTYYSGAAWSDYDIPTWEAWRLYASQYLEGLRHPLQVTLEDR